MPLAITTEILRLVYVVSLEFAALAVVGFLTRIVIRRVVRWYRDAVARTNEYWAVERLECQVSEKPDTSRNSGSSQHLIK